MRTIDEEAFVDKECPKCATGGTVCYYPKGYNGIDYAFINCSNCQCSFRKHDDQWSALIKYLVKRPV